MALQDAFSLFQLPRSFRVDLKELEARYLRLQALFHPDRLAGQSSRERLLAAQKSADLNAAYTLLKDPFLRGKCLLGWEGMDEGETHKDPALLSEILTWRESLSEETGEAARTAFLEERREDYEKTLKALEETFEKGEKEKAKSLLARLSYLKKMIEG